MAEHSNLSQCDDSPFQPDWRSHPGDTLRDLLAERKMSQGYLARATGFSPKHINQVIRGEEPISADFAVRLEQEFGGTPAEFWMTRQMQFDLHAAREACQDPLRRQTH